MAPRFFASLRMTHCKDNSVPNRGEVLVAIVNNRADFALAMEQHWYRVPVSSQEKWLKDYYRLRSWDENGVPTKEALLPAM